MDIYDIPFESALLVLDASESDSNGWHTALCPTHDDTNPSLHIKRADDGSLRVSCKSTCSKEKVLEAIQELIERQGLPIDKTTTTTKKKKITKKTFRNKNIIATYVYKDINGFPIAVKHRFEPKEFQWAKVDDLDTPGLPKGIKEQDLPLYNIDKVIELNREFVFFVEGEKAADAISNAYGFTAVCLPGGANSKINPESLEPLRDRKIVLWGDNDSPGRALMERLFNELIGIAKDIRIIAPYIKEGGDPADYITAGYSREELRDEIKNAPIGEVITETPDGYDIRVPYGGDIVVFRFEDIEVGARSVDVNVDIFYARRPEHKYQCRQNLRSESQKESIVRALQTFFNESDKHGWMNLITKAWSRLITHIKTRITAILVMEPLPARSKNLYAIHPIIANDGLTIHFGMGGSGKSYLMALFALLTATGKRFGELHAVDPGAVVYLDYEASRAKLNFRLKGLLNGFNMEINPDDLPIYYINGAGVPLKMLVPIIRREVNKHEANLLIIDSVGQAAGSDLISQETVSSFANAVDKIGTRACVALAHVTKEEGTKYPFGSVYWHNTPRLTWFVKNYAPTPDSMKIGMAQRKVNDDGPKPHVGVSFTFTGELGEKGFTVDVKPTTPPEKFAGQDGNDDGRDGRKAATKHWYDTIWPVIKDRFDPFTIQDIVQWTGLSKDVVHRVKFIGLDAGQIKEFGEGKGRDAKEYIVIH